MLEIACIRYKSAPTLTLIIGHHDAESSTTGCKMQGLLRKIVEMFQNIGTVNHIVLPFDSSNLFCKKINHVAVLCFPSAYGYIRYVCCRYRSLGIAASKKNGCLAEGAAHIKQGKLSGRQGDNLVKIPDKKFGLLLAVFLLPGTIFFKIAIELV